MTRSRAPSAAAVTDLVSGMAAGLAASLAMNLFQEYLSRLLAKNQSGETAAARAADAICEKVSGAPIKRRYWADADNVMHYLTGALCGGAYGLIGSRLPVLAAGRGLLYGLIVWVAADEALVPALGFAPKPAKTKLSDQGFGLSAHLVFGAALDMCRRCFGRMIAAQPARNG